MFVLTHNQKPLDDISGLCTILAHKQHLLMSLLAASDGASRARVAFSYG